jgi:hypothetical protein
VLLSTSGLAACESISNEAADVVIAALVGWIGSCRLETAAMPQWYRPKRCTMASLRQSIVCSGVIDAYRISSLVTGPSKSAFETATPPMVVPIWSWEADSLLQIAAYVYSVQRQGWRIGAIGIDIDLQRAANQPRELTV